MYIKNKKQYEDIKEEGTISIIDFFADWCGPCKIQSPIIDKLEKDLKGKVGVFKVDIEQEENREIASELGIRGIPSIVVLKDKKVVETLVGVRSEEQLLDVIKKHS